MSKLWTDAEAANAVGVSESTLSLLVRDTPPQAPKPFVVVSGDAHQLRRWFPDLNLIFSWLQRVEEWRVLSKKGSRTSSDGVKGMKGQPENAQTSEPQKPSNGRSSRTSPSTAKASPPLLTLV